MLYISVLTWYDASFIFHVQIEKQDLMCIFIIYLQMSMNPIALYT